MASLLNEISIAVGLIGLATGLILARQPVFVCPSEELRVKGIDRHDRSIHFALFVFSLFILLPIWLSFPEWISALGGLSMGVPLVATYLLYMLVAKLAKRSVSREFENRRSIRLLYCQNCTRQLRKSIGVSDLLTETEQVASRIGSLTFEVWYCQQCSTED